MRNGRSLLMGSTVMLFLLGIFVFFSLAEAETAGAPSDSETLGILASDSAAVFSDSLSLLTPNGGEILASGSTYAITWSASSGAENFKLKYSVDNGLTWYVIDKNVTTTTYNWTVPTPSKNKKKCLVKVIGFNSSGIKVGADKSDAPFTIEVVKITAPNGGEILSSGATHEITWTTNETMALVNDVSLFYSTNGGLKWKKTNGTQVIGTNGGSASWLLPNVSKSKTKCKVKVVLRDGRGIKVGSDTSDGYFTISTAPTTTYPLTVNKNGTGTGTVTSSPVGVSCGTDCVENYASGITVTLTAAATSGSTFAGWSGDCAGTGTCTVTMSQARSVTATFSVQTTTYPLTVNKNGTGTGTVTSSPVGVSCGTDCVENYASGITVTLTAAATSGSTFAGWSGDCAGTGTCTVTMSQARSVTATFSVQTTTYPLTVNKNGTGTGTVTSSPVGVSCGTDCVENYASGITVTLTAAATSGSTFAGWSGDCAGTGTCTVTMSQARSVTATFNTSSQTVTLNPQYDNMVMIQSLGRCSNNNSTVCASNSDCILFNGSGICQFAEQNTVYQNAYLAVGCNWSYNSYLVRQEFICAQSLVRFNTSSLAGKTIDSAILKLVTSSCGVGYNPRQWHVRAMYTSWTPATVTWNIVESSQYYTASEISLNPPCYFGQSQMFEINLTSTVQNWSSGAWNNYGLIFGSEDYAFPYATSFDAFEFYSLEDPGQDWPKLIVTYH